ncbi:MAG: 4-(cytidine 5'-diphospho)-2-C-methyl-D-erythritol kinase [Sedimentisphaerales bacterium]|jgi:4-diphosphocytidyl-2-C-methyl-D-erythritol kinase|nr:4-(cytidine 5'-diphospho)-2-C-methyl-D-erythritol kinase [Sedimentisphaerales bacterium]
MTEKKQIESVGDGVLVRAPAKINLSLLVSDRRADGFHEVETLMAKVNWYDELLVEPGQNSGIEVISKGPQWAPQGKENLVFHACEMLLEHCDKKANLKITLVKNIPAGSGLGSASSDAAAALIAVNRLLELSVEQAKLTEIAAALGSDVAFFLGAPLAFCTGKGEKIKKIDEKFDFLALFLLPDVSVSTKEVYANYEPNQGLFNKLQSRINRHIQKHRFDLVSKMYANMLEISCFSLYKELAELKSDVESQGFRPLCLSGSGSAMFHMFDYMDKEAAQRSSFELEEKFGCRSVIVINNSW